MSDYDYDSSSDSEDIYYPSADELIEYKNILDEQLEQLEKIKTDNEKLNIKIDHQQEFIDNNNVIKKSVLDRINKPLDVPDNEYFSKPTATAVTLKGSLKDIRFTEEDTTIIDRLQVDDDLVRIKSNFGDKYLDAFKQITDSKPKHKEKKRKIQGDGSSLNSQITFMFRSKYLTSAGKQKIYKIKVFRTGKIQLPGARTDLLLEINQKIQKIADSFNKYIYENKQVSVDYLVPCMKNYRFEIIGNHSINLYALKQLLLGIKKYTSGQKITNDNLKADSSEILYVTPDTFNYEKHDILYFENIFDIKYTFEDNHLYAKFLTPTAIQEDKKIKFKFFMEGKVNILGGIEEATTTGCYTFLLELFRRYNDILIVNPQEDDDDYIVVETFPNISFKAEEYMKNNADMIFS